MRRDLCPRPSGAARLFARLCAALMLLASSTAAEAAVFSGFDASPEYWRVTGVDAASWLATGGNPGGCIRIDYDPTPMVPPIAVAPPAFLGDWRALTAADSLSCDILSERVFSPSLAPYFFRIAGPGGAATALGGFVPPANAWTHASVPMDSTAWQMESGTWEALTANVNSLRIECTNLTQRGSVYLDNLRLTFAVAPVTAPCEFETFNDSGLGEWSFSGFDEAANPGSGGNTFGFLYLPNQAGLAWAFAPGRHLGDWSALAAGSSLTFDLRITYANGVRFTSIPELVRLSGPGGTAVAALDPSELPPPGRLWKTVRIPIQPSTWTVTSGSWAGLLANVSECRIQVEYYGGDEACGLDNFGRMGPTCPAMDDPVTVLAPDVALSGWTGFAGIASVARDSVTGMLAGTVDETPENGGGLYAVTGVQAGALLQAYDRPVHVIFDELGAAYVSEDQAGVINRRPSWGGSSVWVSGFQAGDDDPSGMCFAPEGFDGPNVDPGDVLVVDWGGYGSPDGVWSFTIGLPEGERHLLADPGSVDMHDISPGPWGAVVLADALNDSRIYLLDAQGALYPWTLGEPRLGIVSLVYDPLRDRLYIADTGTRSLSYIPCNDASTVVPVASGFNAFAPCCLEIDSPGRRLWITDVGVGRVYEFHLDANAGVDDPGSGSGEGRTNGPLLHALRVWPNPARSASKVQLMLARPADVRVDVLDLAGRLVRRLADARLGAGEHALAWDGRGARGAAVAPGVYVVSARTGDEVRATRVVILR